MSIGISDRYVTKLKLPVFYGKFNLKTITEHKKYPMAFNETIIKLSQKTVGTYLSLQRRVLHGPETNLGNLRQFIYLFFRSSTDRDVVAIIWKLDLKKVIIIVIMKIFEFSCYFSFGDTSLY